MATHNSGARMGPSAGRAPWRHTKVALEWGRVPGGRRGDTQSLFTKRLSEDSLWCRNGFHADRSVVAPLARPFRKSLWVSPANLFYLFIYCVFLRTKTYGISRGRYFLFTKCSWLVTKIGKK